MGNATRYDCCTTIQVHPISIGPSRHEQDHKQREKTKSAEPENCSSFSGVLKARPNDKIGLRYTNRRQIDRLVR